MSITTLVLAGALAVIANAPVEITLDFAEATTGIDYVRIEVKLFASTGKQKGRTQTCEYGARADADDLLSFFQTQMSNLGLTATLIAGTKQIRIVGPRSEFARIEYSTSTPKNGEWVPNAKIKGPSVVGKPAVRAPSFVVNPKPL